MTTEIESERCIVSKSRMTAIDTINPATGRTVCYGKTLADCRKEYPDAEEMTLEAFCAWKGAQQRTAITWNDTTEADYEYGLNVLPPVAWGRGAFCVGEAYDHEADTGRPRYQAYRQAGKRFYKSSRPVTVAELKAELTRLGY